jgi:predicted house-cleaning NTP pyrophosphatase (Maf/HAM1 superfamily)
MPYIILASSSPRREEFLKRLGIKFKVMVPLIDEVSLEGESPEEFCTQGFYRKSIICGQRFK